MHDLEVETDHFQFYFGDARKGPVTETGSLWDAGGDVVVGPDRDVVGVGTVRDGGTTRIQAGVVPGRATIGAEPGWRTLGEFQLDVPSGKVRFWAAEDGDLTWPSPELDPHGPAGSRGTRGRPRRRRARL